MKIGPLELIVILVVALLVIGPDKLPAYAKKFGEGMKEFKKASSTITDEINEDVVEPIKEAKAPFEEAIAPIKETTDAIEGNLKSVTDSINEIGK